MEAIAYFATIGSFQSHFAYCGVQQLHAMPANAIPDQTNKNSLYTLIAKADSLC